MSGNLSSVSRRLHTVLRHVSASSRSRQVQSAEHMSTSAEQPAIHAHPRVALYDDDVRITLRNFPPQQKVTLHGQVMQLTSKIIFASCGHFITSSDGDVDLYRDESQGGTFTGVDPMGILWSLRTAPGHAPDTRMAINFTDKPCQVNLKAYLGHLSLEDIYRDVASSNLVPVAQGELERWFRGQGVTRVEIEDGNIRGALYLPPGDGPFKGVIDMFGSSGGLIEYRSALLASRGFASFSLAYFKYKDLQPTLVDLKYEYFEEAIEWLTKHPKVCGNQIGVISTSKGVENGLLMGAYSPKVSAVIAINGYSYGTFADILRYGKVFLKAGEMNLETVVTTEEGVDVREMFRPKGDYIPIWQGQAKYLFLESQDDYQKYADANDYALQELCPPDRRKDIQVVKYEGAGHLLEPPYNPLCRSSVNKNFGIKMKWGGHPKQHAQAQYDAWSRTLHFLNTNIPGS